MTLEELALRCEQASGPDRGIDRDIALALSMYDNPEDLGCFKDVARAVVGGGGETWEPSEYTASLDAAMTLVPDGWVVHSLGETRHMIGGLWLALLHPKHIGPPFNQGAPASAASPALALCASALRARAAADT